MKKGKLLAIINENTEKTHLTNMNEDSYYDGYKFVEYGKNIENVTVIMPSNEDHAFTIDKDKLVINWGAKFEFVNSGIEGVQISVLNLEASIKGTVEGEEKNIPVNFGEYKFEVTKEKNVESEDVKIYILSIEVDVENKIVNVVVSI